MSSYNGWSNYETWNVALWIDNEPGSHRHARELAQEAWDGARAGSVFTREENAAQELAEMLEEWNDGSNPLAGTSSMFADLLSSALSEVDWYEIAENFLDDIDKTEDDDADEEETL